jgi:hypothetical protein
MCPCSGGSSFGVAKRRVYLLLSYAQKVSNILKRMLTKFHQCPVKTLQKPSQKESLSVVRF